MNETTGDIECGSCFCGEITAELHGLPFWVCYDHDDDCRRAIGSPIVVWVGVRPSQFHVTHGNPRIFSKTPSITRSFCAKCGTSITYRDQGLPDELYVAVGFFDRPERFKPEAHAYWDHQLPWIEFSDDLSRRNTYSRERTPGTGTPRDRRKELEVRKPKTTN